ncbi:MAG: hypothetical protein AAGA10_16085 [Bacteroidota bacterium]
MILTIDLISPIDLMVISDVYKTFLNATKLSIWKECLEEYHSFLKSSEYTSKEAIDELPRGLYIAIYTRWLSWLWGDRKGLKQASDIFEEMVEMVEKTHLRFNSKPLQLARAIIACGKSYTRRAKELIDEAGLAITPEIACLIVPKSPTQKAIFLKPFVKTSRESFFLPAFYFYCDALLQLGNFREINLRLQGMEQYDSNGFIIDLKGQMSEREGRWDEAFDVYKTSDWAIHQFRALICENILHSRNSENRIKERLAQDKKVYEGMNNFEGEIDQLELARSQAFIHACRWYSFDTWLVNFELGKLNFRRRRYLDAELHLKKAVENAPEDFRFHIHTLRHTNLSWVNEDKHGFHMTPEALESAIDVIGSLADEEMKTSAYAWIFMTTQDQRFLQPILESSSLYDIGNAYSLLEDSPKALYNWRLSTKERYYHRNVSNLIRFFNEVQFYHTTQYLASVVMKEDEENFFGLWELGRDWLNILKQNRNFSGKGASQQEVLVNILRRLEVLSQDNFQDLMRAAELFIEMKRVDIAETLIVKAEKLAESPGELIEVAITRRLSPAFNRLLGDNRGLECLLKAEKESQSRIERLQIARELGVYYRQVQRGRRMLEQLLKPKELSSFQPIEYVVALQCSPLMGQEEVEKLIERATDSLKQDFKQGIIKSFGTRFVERINRVNALPFSLFDKLKEELTIISPKLDADSNIYPHQNETEKAITASSHNDAKDSTKLSSDNWKEFATTLGSSKYKEEEEEQKFWQEITSQLGSMGLDSKYCLWKWLQQEIHQLEKETVNFRPEFEQEKTPISKGGVIVGDVRADGLSKLWKDYFFEPDGPNKSWRLGRISDFDREEKQLLEEWKKMREVGMKKPAKRMLCLVGNALKVLDSIQSEENQTGNWPLFLHVEEYLMKDIKLQIDRLEKLRTKFQNDSESNFV